MATLKTNTLTGTSTAGSIAVTAEGNSTTTNLQQGLIKCWVSFGGASATVADSFNLTSVDDDGTGDFGINIANDMANTTYAVLGAVTEKHSTAIHTVETTNGQQTTGAFDCETAYANSGNNRTNDDLNDVYIAVAGDLA